MSEEIGKLDEEKIRVYTIKERIGDDRLIISYAKGNPHNESFSQIYWCSSLPSGNTFFRLSDDLWRFQINMDQIPQFIEFLQRCIKEYKYKNITPDAIAEIYKPTEFAVSEYDQWEKYKDFNEAIYEYRRFSAEMVSNQNDIDKMMIMEEEMISDFAKKYNLKYNKDYRGKYD
jgi:hypothetical protein